MFLDCDFTGKLDKETGTNKESALLNYLYWPRMSLSVVLVGNMWVLPSILNRLLAAQTQAPPGVGWMGGWAGEWEVLIGGLTFPFFLFLIQGIDYAYFFRLVPGLCG